MSSSCSSLIKGGGRADLSPQVEAAVIDFLRSQRDAQNPLLPKRRTTKEACCEDDDEKEESPHDAEKNRKRFLKRLVQQYEQHALSSKLNKTSNVNTTSSEPTKATSAAKSASNVTGKVRLDIVEAIYKKGSGNNDSWKPGSTKKTLVLERCTTVGEVLKLAQAKLKLKKKPTRVFYVEKKKKKLEIPLTTNLAGLSDGATIYVSIVPIKPDKTKTAVASKDAALENEDEIAGTLSSSETVPIDPLEAAKEAYALKEQSRSSTVSLRNGNSRTTGTLKERVTFTPHLDQLCPLTAERQQLPAASFRRNILEAMDKSRVVIICGETGCGKSTQIPQFIYEGMLAAGQGPNANIVVTQPRRVAAMALADRVAEEQQATMSAAAGSSSSTRNCSSNSSTPVAYQVRLDSTVTKQTKITYCTVGILLRRLTSFRSTNEDIPLADVSHLIIDEVHERDCNTDFCLTILRHALAVNPRLSLILMSATNTPDLFCDYFSQSPQKSARDDSAITTDWNPVVLKIPGRTFPVEKVWLTDIEKRIGKTMKGMAYGSDSTDSTRDDGQATTGDENDSGVALSPKATAAIDYDFLSSLIQSIASGGYAVNNRSGAILVFLPGKAEIEAQRRSLEITQDGSRFMICTLHSGVPKQSQRVAFSSPPKGTTKVVLATNLAETSITIPDVVYVIDTGLVKEVRYNPASSMEELVTVWTSMAAGTQRQGRAGRTGPGICFKLYTERFADSNLLQRTTPEILRTPLEELVLSVCLLDETRSYRQSKKGAKPAGGGRRPPGTRIIRFLGQAPDPPREESLRDACRHLVDVGALKVISSESDGGGDLCVKVTPLGFHLAHFPLSAKLGKVLILGSILGCVDTALTVAASLSTTKPLWLKCPGAREAQREVVRSGFGGEGWPGGASKGDLIASVAAFNAWDGQNDDKARRKFAQRSFLNHQILAEMASLRGQFRNCLVDAGFVRKNSKSDGNEHSDNALLTSCCILAGLYPNISTLVRPVKGKLGFRGGRLLTRDGDSCIPSSSSFQSERVRTVSETGRDAYAVYHSKLKLSGTDKMRADRIILDGVNFVSRFALILFGGELEVRDNFLVVDEWLKFKVSSSSSTGSGDDTRKKARPAIAVLLLELRKELDDLLLQRLYHCCRSNDEADESDMRSEELIRLVIRILQQE